LNTDTCKFESSQKMKAEPVRLILQKLTENLELLIGIICLSWSFVLTLCCVLTYRYRKFRCGPF